MNTFKINPPVIAHRGASAYAPENTMVAFVKAAQLGIRWVEFDVMQTACGEVIVFHDDSLERTTNGRGEIQSISYAKLRTLDAGSWFDPRFAGEHVPTLPQVLTFLNEANMSVNIEMKSLPGLEEPLVIKTLEIVASMTKNFKQTILYSSFSIRALELIRHYAPNALTGLLLHEWEPDWENICERLQCVSVHVFEEIMTREMAHKIKRMNKQLFCYTVNDVPRALQLFADGVDAVFSDVPDVIAYKTFPRPFLLTTNRD